MIDWKTYEIQICEAFAVSSEKINSLEKKEKHDEWAIYVERMCVSRFDHLKINIFISRLISSQT